MDVEKPWICPAAGSVRRSVRRSRGTSSDEDIGSLVVVVSGLAVIGAAAVANTPNPEVSAGASVLGDAEVPNGRGGVNVYPILRNHRSGCHSTVRLG